MPCWTLPSPRFALQIGMGNCSTFGMALLHCCCSTHRATSRSKLRRRRWAAICPSLLISGPSLPPCLAHSCLKNIKHRVVEISPAATDKRNSRTSSGTVACHGPPGPGPPCSSLLHTQKQRPPQQKQKRHRPPQHQLGQGNSSRNAPSSTQCSGSSILTLRAKHPPHAHTQPAAAHHKQNPDVTAA